MATKFTSEVMELQGLIDKRLSQLNQVKTILNLGGSDFDLVMQDFSNALSSFTSFITNSDADFIKGELEALQKTSLSSIPVAELEGSTAIAAMHNKFKSLTASVMSSNYLPDFFQQIVKDGCDKINSECSDTIGKITTLKNNITAHAEDIKAYLDSVENNPEIDMPQKILANKDVIINDSRDMYLKMVKMFNNIKETNNFSDSLMDGVISKAESLVANLGSIQSKNPAIAASSLDGFLAELDDTQFKLENLKDYGSKLPQMADEFSNLDLSDILRENFSNILSNGNRVLRLANSAITSAESGNGQGLIQSVKEILTQVSYIKGQLGQMQKRKIKDILPTGSQIESDFNALKTAADNFTQTFPEEAMRILQSDINSIISITRQLAEPISNLARRRRPSSSEIDTITNRIGTKASDITSHMAGLITAVNAFPAGVASIATNAISALKAIAPTPMEQLAKGNVLSFKKTLDNPMLLTKIGACQESINQAMADPEIGAVELGMLTTLLDFVNGEFEREMMTNFISDFDLQKSIAIKGVDDYVTEILTPKKQLLERYKNLIAQKESAR